MSVGGARKSRTGLLQTEVFIEMEPPQRDCYRDRDMCYGVQEREERRERREIKGGEILTRSLYSSEGVYWFPHWVITNSNCLRFSQEDERKEKKWQRPGKR